MSDSAFSADDMLDKIRLFTDETSLKNFLDKKGYMLESVLQTNSESKMYNFYSEAEYPLGAGEESIMVPNIIVVRIDKGAEIKKLTLMSPAKDYSDGIKRQLVAKKFQRQDNTGKNDAIVITSALYPKLLIVVSTVKAVKGGHAYDRYQISLSYARSLL